MCIHVYMALMYSRLWTALVVKGKSPWFERTPWVQRLLLLPAKYRSQAIDLSIYLSIYLTSSVCIYQLLICQCSLSISRSICLSICQSIDRSVDMSIDRPIYLSLCIHPSRFLSPLALSPSLPSLSSLSLPVTIHLDIYIYIHTSLSLSLSPTAP